VWIYNFRVICDRYSPWTESIANNKRKSKRGREEAKIEPTERTMRVEIWRKR
jgi:hypothetical protein